MKQDIAMEHFGLRENFLKVCRVRGVKSTRTKLWCCQQQSVGLNPFNDTCALEQDTFDNCFVTSKESGVFCTTSQWMIYLPTSLFYRQ